VARGVTRNNGLVFTIILALGLCNIAIGMLVQIIPLVMDGEHDTKFLIGANAMVGQTGTLLSGLGLTYLRRRFPSHALVMTGIGVLFLSMLAFAFTSPIWAWFAIRFFAGACTSIVFTTGESWLQANSNDVSRGRVMGSYMTSQSITFAIGPFLIPFTGIGGATPWLFAVAMLGFGFMLMSRVKIEETHKRDGVAGLWATLCKGPLIFLSIGVATMFEGITLSFFTLYAIHQGMELANATRLLSFGIALCLLFFVPIGYLADHWSRRGTVAICAVVTIFTSLLQIVAIGTWWMWPLIVVLRAAAFGTYLCGFGMLGDKFKGAELVAASALVSILWGLGGMISAPIAGFVFDIWGIALLPWLLAACYVPVLVGLAVIKD
jgi:MFS family permease